MRSCGMVSGRIQDTIPQNEQVYEQDHILTLYAERDEAEKCQHAYSKCTYWWVLKTRAYIICSFI
jgi:hypothetical protein